MTPTPRQIRRGAIAVYLVVATAQALLTPPLEAPDELSHLRYVNFVAQRLELPNQYDPDRFVRGQGHQAPAYYMLAGMFVRLTVPDHTVTLTFARNPDHSWRDPARRQVRLHLPAETGFFRSPRDRFVFYALRLLSVAFGLLTLLGVGAIAAALTGQRRAGAVAMGLAACLPQFTFVAGMITADNLAAAGCTWTAWAFLRALDAPERLRGWALTGALLGLALITKKTAMFLLPAMAVLIGLRAFAMPSRRPALARGSAVLVVTAVAVTGWLFARNVRLYGELLTATMEARTMPNLIHHKTLTHPYFRDYFPRALAQSFIAHFGWLNVQVAAWVYATWATIAAAGFFGIVGRLAQWPHRVPGLLTALLFSGACLSGIVFYNLDYNQAQGRYLFPALGFLATLVVLGGEAWRSWLPPAIVRAAMLLAATTLVAGQIASLVAVVRFYGA